MDAETMMRLAGFVSVVHSTGYGYSSRIRECCNACRNYRLDRQWCHLCNGRGYVEKDKPNER